MTESTNNTAYGQPDGPDANQQKDEPTVDAGGAEQMLRSASPPADGGIPTPGDAQGVAVPSVQAAAGTSEQSHAAEGVTTTSLAPPGKPDGEVDTRA